MKREVEVTTVEAHGRFRFEDVTAQHLNAEPPNENTTRWALVGFSVCAGIGVNEGLLYYCAVLTREVQS